MSTTFEVGVAFPLEYYTGVTGSTVTYVVKDEVGGVFATGTLSESGTIVGLYEGSFTPDTAGFWLYVITCGTAVLAQEVPIAVGTLSNATSGLVALNTKLVTIDANQDVPATDSTNDALSRDVVGKKDDSASITVTDTNSLIAYAKGIINLANAAYAYTALIPASPASSTDALAALVTDDLDHMLKVAHPTGLPTKDSISDLVMNKDASQTFARATDSLEAIRDAVAALSSGTGRAVNDFVIYLAAEDMAATELTDNGSSPVFTAEVSKTTANEAAGVASPAWSEDYNLEQAMTVNLVSVFMDLEAQLKITGSGTGYAKWQMSGDGGATWVDVTDNFSTTSTDFEDFIRIGVGVPFAVIVAGANQLQARLCTWTGATSVQSKIRSNTYIRVTGRGS